MPTDSAAPDTILALLRRTATANPEAVALTAPGRPPLRYGELLASVERVAASLRAHGIAPGDRVAIVMPNGPEMAVSFLATASAATSAPLNPAYGAAELAFYFADLQPRALLVLGDGADAAAETARTHGVVVLRARVPDDAPAGAFDLPAPALPVGVAGAHPAPDDVALVLHTSGTTSRPKMVPLRHANLCASARSVAETLALTPDDRCLNVMPLFHIHGIVAALLASIAAGASVACTPGFFATDFFGWLEESNATWYTAVPTMHQAVLARADSERGIIAASRLRLIRSSSAALPPSVLSSLEETFGVPVIEAYGMTEASHQMASNPLPPRHRKAGSVGTAAGPQVAVMDDAGSLLDPGTTGEIVVRGPGITSGYVANEEANASAFTDGWFRTGDVGYLDADGYLFLTGRRKEIINRGGEKIAPREIDEVLLDHPAVAEAAAFAVPHDTLGEEVGAAVVLRKGSDVTEAQLRSFAAARLAQFKVPTRLVILDAIPKGPTGKIQRVGMAERLGISASAEAPSAEFAPPTTAVERRLCGMWEEVLGVERIGLDDDFFLLGGDSMLATRVVARVRDAFGRELPLLALFEAPTVRSLAGVIDGEGTLEAAEESA